MKQRHAQYSNITYRVSDCRNMPEFTDCSFGHVLDKGACVFGVACRGHQLQTTCTLKGGQQRSA
jgi:hypothetical protein